MRYLLDTNVCIQLLKGNSFSMLKRIGNVPVNDIIIPAIVRYELYYGAYKSNKTNETLMELVEFLGSFETIGFNNQIAEAAGKIRAAL